MNRWATVAPSSVRTQTLAYHPLTLVMLAGPAGLGAAAAWYLEK